MSTHGFADITQELWRMKCCGYLASHAVVTKNWTNIKGSYGNDELVVETCPNPYCPSNKR